MPYLNCILYFAPSILINSKNYYLSFSISSIKIAIGDLATKVWSEFKWILVENEALYLPLLTSKNFSSKNDKTQVTQFEG